LSEFRSRFLWLFVEVCIWWQDCYAVGFVLELTAKYTFDDNFIFPFRALSSLWPSPFFKSRKHVGCSPGLVVNYA
jgi:hypothetical protein